MTIELINHADYLTEEVATLVEERILDMQAQVNHDFGRKGYRVTVTGYDLATGHYDFKLVAPDGRKLDTTGTLAALALIVRWGEEDF